MLLAESYLHRLDPFAVQFTDTFGIRWYGLAYAAGFLVAWLFFRWMAKSGRSPMTVKSAGDLMTYIIGGILIGGRLGYAVFYDRSLITGFSSSIPFWDLLAINKGGMSSHGGVIGYIIGCALFGARQKVSILHLLDLGGFSCTFGLFFGRLANFVNAELWGRALPPHLQENPPWWSVKYPQEVLDDRFANQEALEVLRGTIGGDQTFRDSVVAAVQQGDATIIETVRPLLTAYYPSQIFQAITDGPILAGILALIWLKPRKPGVIGAWFLIGYGALRILTEFFREPDLGIDLMMGLSRGQWLSILMVMCGVVGLIVVSRRDVAPMGGFVRGSDEGS